MFQHCCLNVACLFDSGPVPLKSAREWKEGPVVKGWQRCHTSVALNKYLIKTLPFNSLSKAHVLQSFQPQCKRWWGKQNGQCRFLMAALVVSLFAPLPTPVFPPSLPSVCLCSSCTFFLSCVSFLQKNTFYVFSDCRLLILTLLPLSLRRRALYCISVIIPLNVSFLVA